METNRSAPHNERLQAELKAVILTFSMIHARCLPMPLESSGIPNTLESQYEMGSHSIDMNINDNRLCRAAEYFDGRTDVQCLHRWQKVLNPDVVKGPWTPEVTCLPFLNSQYLLYPLVKSRVMRSGTCNVEA